MSDQDESLPPELERMVDDAVERLRIEQEGIERLLAAMVEARVAVLQAGWRSAHEMHSRHHWCIDRQERTRPFKIGERCPTLEALESGRAVTP